MAIEVKNISYTYPGSTVTAVENVSRKKVRWLDLSDQMEQGNLRP